MRDDLKWTASRTCLMGRDTAPSFLELVQALHQVERWDRSTGACMLISMDQAVRELSACHANPLELLLQRATLPTPPALYRLHVTETYVN